MTIALYGQSDYDRSGKIRWLLEELGVPYENKWLDREKKEVEGPGYLAVNPLGRIPAAVIGDRPMIDSGAIAAYIADAYMDKGLAPALSSPERLDYQQWLYFAATSIDQFASRISIIEDIPPGEVLEKKMGDLLSEVRDSIEFLDRTLAKKDYVTGKFSTADIAIGYHLYFASLWPEMKEVIEFNSHVSAYLERLMNRPAAVKAKVFTFDA